MAAHLKFGFVGFFDLRVFARHVGFSLLAGPRCACCPAVSVISTVVEAAPEVKDGRRPAGPWADTLSGLLFHIRPKVYDGGAGLA
ncbi:hypothetical protein NicSoilB11_09210 [Arthrobacter sp. NicSoilB11]|nr:hypothetical protein NicSoilB11_09210 [Arthrobacter sp. NicSoilB11]